VSISRNSDQDVFPVVIIGAGIAGLTAAVHLAEGGIPPLILEADRLWPGGRLAGGDADVFEHKGRTWSFASEHGIHAVWGGYENLRAMITRFTDTKLIDSPGEEWINRWGREVRMIEAGNAVRSRWLPAPFHYLQLLFHPQIWANITPLDFLSLPGFLFSILWTVGLDPLKEQIALDGLMMKEYFRGWTPNLRATFTGVGINLLAAPAETISLTAFIAALRFYTTLRRDSWRMQYFPDNPHNALLQPLIDRIKSREGQLLHGATAQRLERIADVWRVVVEDSVRGGMRSVLAKNVILAIPPAAAQRLLMNSPDTDAAKIRFPGVIGNASVRLWFDASPRPGTPGGMFTGDFLPDNFFWLHRLYDDIATWHNQTGGSAIEVHLYANKSVMEQPDNILLIKVLDDVQRAFPAIKGHFVHGVVRRNSLNHPLFRVPTADSLHFETPWPNILACGDWIGYSTPSFWMERACITGIAAANQILQLKGLESFPIIEAQQPEILARVLGAVVRGFRQTVGRVILSGARGIKKLIPSA
jgi:carotenoid phi-ring synthase / carotenoid chi-ring synthase